MQCQLFWQKNTFPAADHRLKILQIRAGTPNNTGEVCRGMDIEPCRNACDISCQH